MTVRLLDPAILDRADAGTSVDRWRAVLNEGGWLVDGEGELRQIRTLLSAMDEADAVLERSGHPIPWLTGTVPPPVWAGIVGSFVCFGLIGGALVGGLVTLALAALASLAGLGLAVAHERERRRVHAAAKQERRARADALVGLLRDLSSRTFLYPRPGLLLVSAPYRHQLTERLRELQASRPQGWDEEVTRLREEMERIDSALRGNPRVEELQP